MPLDTFSWRTNQQPLSPRLPSFSAFGDLRTCVLAGVISLIQAGEASAPTAVAAGPVLAEKKLTAEQMRELFDLRSLPPAEKVQAGAAPEDTLAGAIKFSEIPEGASVLGKPIIIAKVRLRIDLEDTAVCINVEGTEFCSHESLIPLTGSQAMRTDVSGARIAHPHLGTFVVDRGQLDLLARTLQKARTGECTVTVPITYRPEKGLVSAGRKAQTVTHSMRKFFSSKPVPLPPDPTISFVFERVSPAATVAQK